MQDVKIQIKLSPSHFEDRFENVSLEQLGIESIEEWDSMTQVQKHDLIVDYVNEMPNQPYWDVAGFKTKS